MTTPTQPSDTQRVLTLLAGGKTTQATADLTGWPRSRVLALINGQKGWLIDAATDKVYAPGERNGVPKVESREPAADTEHPAVQADTITVLSVRAIEPHPGNIRGQLGDLDEMAASIRQHGILQPLVVQRHPSSTGRYRLLAGHRRLAAAQIAGLTAVPVVIRGDATAEVSIELMLVENCHRTDLNPIERARAFAELRRRGYSQQKISERTGIHSSTISTALALMELDETTQELVRTGELGAGDAVAAVRKARAVNRKKTTGRTADYTWEPDYLAATHPLAKKARNLCDARDHGMRRRIGKSACGQCWETAIRLDEQTVQRTTRGQQ